MRKPNLVLVIADCWTYHAFQRMRKGKGRKKDMWFGKWSQGRHAVTYTNALSVSQCSDPNYVSMFSGLYGPDEAGVYQQIGRDRTLRDLKFVQGALKKKGYTIISIGAYQSRYFLRGADFEWWTDSWKGEKSAVAWKQGLKEASAGGKGQRKLAEDAFEALLKKARKQTMMRAVNLIDPLSKPFYVAIRFMYQHAPRAGGPYFPVKGAKESSLQILNEQLKFLLERLTARRDDTLIVIMADHGDMGGMPKDYKHGSSLGPKRHARNLVEALIHVPCVIWSRKLERRRTSALVQPAVDFLPTVYAYAGWEPDWEFSGRDMLSEEVLGGKGRHYAHMAGVEVDRPKGWKFRAVRAADGSMYRVLLSPDGKLIEEARGIAKEPGRFMILDWIKKMKRDTPSIRSRKAMWGGCDKLDEELAKLR